MSIAPLGTVRVTPSGTFQYVFHCRSVKKFVSFSPQFAISAVTELQRAFSAACEAVSGPASSSETSGVRGERAGSEVVAALATSYSRDFFFKSN